MSKRAEEAAMKAYPELLSGSIFGPLPVDLNKASREKYQEGYEQAEKDLGWRSVNESLPEMDEEVIVLRDKQNTGLVYEISFGHLVDTERCIDYNGWNVPDVKFWMPMPKIPNEE